MNWDETDFAYFLDNLVVVEGTAYHDRLIKLIINGFGGQVRPARLA